MASGYGSFPGGPTGPPSFPGGPGGPASGPFSIGGRAASGAVAAAAAAAAAGFPGGDPAGDPFGFKGTGLNASPAAGDSAAAAALLQNPQMDRPGSEHSILRSGGSHGKQGSLNRHIGTLELIFVPWLFLVLVLASFLHVGTFGYFPAGHLVPVLLISLNVWFLRHQYTMFNNPEVVLGALCLAALVIGTIAGEYALSSSLREYHRLNQGASYSNVLPTEAGASKNDATTISFVNGTRVDVTRSFGFTDARDEAAPVYCVAPVSAGALYNKRIQYWAAGINCCENRGNFECFKNPGSASASGAIVMSKDLQSVDGFRNAVLGAQGAYGLTSGDEYLLVEWTKEPAAYARKLWSGTAEVFAIMAVAYLFISAMIGIALKPVVASTEGYSYGGFA